MQFSFKEFNQKLQLPTQQKQLRLAEDKFAMLQTLGEHLQPLVNFYDKAVEYWKEKHRIMVGLNLRTGSNYEFNHFISFRNSL